MTQSVLERIEQAEGLFLHGEPGPLGVVELDDAPREALVVANRELGLALADDEIDYLVARYAEMDREPTDAELMMFAQANSEHCRHKVFNATWTVDDATGDGDAVRHDPQHPREVARAHAVGLLGQRRGHHRRPGQALLR